MSAGDPGGARDPAAGKLGFVVRGEALRADAESRIRPDPARIAEGWERRFVIERARAADLVSLYEAAGFEVVVDPVPPELVAEECTDCRVVGQLEFVSVYTRRR